MVTAEDLIKEAVKCFDHLELLESKVIVLFNRHAKKLCRHWHKATEKAELFMNWQCGFSRRGGPYEDGSDNCCILMCPAEKRDPNNPAGILAAMHTETFKINSVLVGEIFNGVLAKQCKYNGENKVGVTVYTCSHPHCENHHCCVVACPLRHDEEVG